MIAWTGVGRIPGGRTEGVEDGPGGCGYEGMNPGAGGGAPFGSALSNGGKFHPTFILEEGYWVMWGTGRVDGVSRGTCSQ